MALEIATATDHADLYDRLISFLESTTPGPEWTLLDYDTSTPSALFVAPGMSGLESIYFGFSLHASISDDAYALGLWMFRDYNAALAHLAQPGHSGVVYLPLWNTSMPYWFIANAQRLMIVSKVSTTYQSSYCGKFLPQGTPGEYPQPYYLAAPVETPTTRWSTINEAHRNFWDPGAAAVVGLPGAIWRNIQNHFETSGGEAASDSTNYIWPFSSPITNASARSRYRELRENLDGSYPLWPTVINGEDPDLDTYGELDGVFAISGFNNASENLVEIGSDDYLVVQNMHRTERYYYAALKLE
jgi:hypothetical protein